MELKLVRMRLKLPLLRARYIPPARAPILRYGVAVLSITLALIPALMLADVVESRLVVFAVAIMVSAWYGGWKPGLVATSFALTVSAYFSLAGEHSPAEYRKAIDVDPSFADWHYRLGRLLRDKGDLAAALPELELASALDSSNEEYEKAKKDLQQQLIH